MVVRYAAIAAVAIVALEIGLVLIGGDRVALCTEFGEEARARTELTVIMMIVMFSLPAAAVLVYQAVRWDAVARKMTARLEMYMRQSRDDPSMEQHFGFTPLTVRYFPVNAVWTVAVTGFVTFCGLPLIPLFVRCL